MVQLPAGQLTEKQAEFVRLLSQGVAKVQSARLAGYAHPDVEPSRLLALPHVRAALQREHARIISSEIVPLAIGKLKGLFLSTTLSDSNLIKAIDLALKADGLHKSSGDAGVGDSKALADMGKGELEDLVSRLQTAVSAHEAKTIDATPDSVTVIDDPLESLL